MDQDRRIAALERDVAQLKRQMDELTRYLKRVENDGVQRAARRAQNA